MIKKKVSLYFGSFNPIHIGHQQLANYLIDNNLSDEVWFVISPHNPLKKSSELLDENIRLKLVEISINKNSRLKTCDIEFKMPIPSYTIDTLKKLSIQYKNIDFSIIIGSDNALIFDKWKYYNYIIDNYSIFVYPRLGYDFNLIKDKYNKMTLLNTPYYDISSTMIRNNIEKNKEWLNEDVYNYIMDNNLYKTY